MFPLLSGIIRMSSARLAEIQRGIEMQDATADFERLRHRMAGIRSQLDGDWSEKLDAQLHLDRDKSECAYWHAGYYQALADILDLAAGPSATSDIEDKSNRCLAAG